LSAACFKRDTDSLTCGIHELLVFDQIEQLIKLHIERSCIMSSSATLATTIPKTIPKAVNLPLLTEVGLICAGSVDRAALEESIELSSGMTPAASQYETLPYWEKAFVPRLPWRKPVREELDRLCGSWEDVRPGTWIQLFSFPQRIYAAFESLRDASSKVTSERELDALRPTAECQNAVKVAVEFANALVFQATAVGEANVYFNLPDLPTTANFRDPLLLGMHTDTSCSASIKYRPFSRNRLCLNLGLYDRYLLFVNLGLKRIETLLREYQIEYEETRGTLPLLGFRTAFMSTFADYPVVRLRLRPGQGYLAPTDNVIHDGSSAGQTAFDISFQAHGHFRPILE
jgi:hypothetical protein